MIKKKKRPYTVAAEQGQCVIRIQGVEVKDIKRLLRWIRKNGFEYNAELPINKEFRHLYSKDYESL